MGDREIDSAGLAQREDRDGHGLWTNNSAASRGRKAGGRHHWEAIRFCTSWINHQYFGEIL
jgi:hypothetical protein